MPPCAILGREKHIYSIYRKMKNKQLSFNEVMDVYAFRMIVDSVDQCYRVMGLVHRLFKPVPDRFKDYIAIPKANGYQSLHTTLFGPSGLPIEIQIRTAEMDQMAHSGIAAHWLYKSGDQDMSQPKQRAQEWVEKLLELQKKTGSSLEFIESVKLDLFPEDVYIFTPKGDIMQLPTGATAVDFAFAVHTDVGNSCVGVKIDRQISPLSIPLANGQTVEIITSPTGRPNPAWLDIVNTSKARSSLRHYFKNQRNDQSIRLGREMLDKALQQHNTSMEVLHQQTIKALLEEINISDIDSLLSDIGAGNRIAVLVARRLNDIEAANYNKQADLDLDHNLQSVCITGSQGMAIKYATCCTPIPGDLVVGEIDSDAGIMVHRERCKHINKSRLDPEKITPLHWDAACRGNFLAVIFLYILHQPGALADTLLSIADCGANVEDFSVVSRNSNFAVLNMHLRVRDRTHLARILRAIRKNKVVRRVVRDI